MQVIVNGSADILGIAFQSLLQFLQLLAVLFLGQRLVLLILLGQPVQLLPIGGVGALLGLLLQL